MTDHPTARHPSRFVWDFWYHFDPAEGYFHVLFLNADPALVPEDQHHFAAQIGYAVTRDFVTVDWIDDCVFAAAPDGWDNSAIWSGDLLRVSDGYLFFYTSRDNRAGDGMTQQVGLAFSKDLRQWRRLDRPLIAADPRWYKTASDPAEATIHAWRDPFLWREGDRIGMLLSAKAARAPADRSGAVAQLYADAANPLTWLALPPLFAPGCYAECEVPQLYHTPARARTLTYSCWARFDKAETTGGAGGFQAVEIDGTPSAPRVLVAEAESLYACRVIPELSGAIVGFDLATGGLRRLDKNLDLQHMPRDFSDIRAEPLFEAPDKAASH